MTQQSSIPGATARGDRRVRAGYVGISAALGVALASYAIPIYDDDVARTAASPVMHFLFRPHIENLDSSWSGQPLRLLLIATIWCLGTTLVIAMRARRNAHAALSRWLIGLSLASSGLSGWLFVMVHRSLWEGAMAPGTALACGASSAALLGSLLLNHRRAHG